MYEGPTVKDVNHWTTYTGDLFRIGNIYVEPAPHFLDELIIEEWHTNVPQIH